MPKSKHSCSKKSASPDSESEDEGDCLKQYFSGASDLMLQFVKQQTELCKNVKIQEQISGILYRSHYFYGTGPNKAAYC